MPGTSRLFWTVEPLKWNTQPIEPDPVPPTAHTSVRELPHTAWKRSTLKFVLSPVGIDCHDVPSYSRNTPSPTPTTSPAEAPHTPNISPNPVSIDVHAVPSYSRIPHWAAAYARF